MCNHFLFFFKLAWLLLVSSENVKILIFKCRSRHSSFVHPSIHPFTHKLKSPDNLKSNQDLSSECFDTKHMGAFLNKI